MGHFTELMQNRGKRYEDYYKKLQTIFEKLASRLFFLLQNFVPLSSSQMNTN